LPVADPLAALLDGGGPRGDGGALLGDCGGRDAAACVLAASGAPREEVVGIFVFCFFWTSLFHQPYSWQLSMLIPATKEKHYEEICSIEAASYPGDEAASPEGIAMRCVSFPAAVCSTCCIFR